MSDQGDGASGAAGAALVGGVLEQRTRPVDRAAADAARRRWRELPEVGLHAGPVDRPALDQL
ncbi:MAG: hypothetical protein R2755_11600 [Acidimicrobiales bacterium]